MKNIVFKLAVILLFSIVLIDTGSRFLAGIKEEVVSTSFNFKKKGYGVPRKIDKNIFLKLMKKGSLSDQEALFYEHVEKSSRKTRRY